MLPSPTPSGPPRRLAASADLLKTNKALDGPFYMVAEEKKKTRTNPAARTTDLLKAVFGRQTVACVARWLLLVIAVV